MRTPTAQPKRSRWNARNDEGSLLLVILFTIMMTSLVLVATATMISGLEKSRNSRDYAIALQTADLAFSDALMYANTNKFPETGTTVTHSGEVGNVKWTWTATRQPLEARTWNITVRTYGENLDRNFRAVYKGTRVSKGIYNTTTGALRYVVDERDFFGYGFYGHEGVTATGAPEVDGYNGQEGLVSSSRNLVLNSAVVERIGLWSYVSNSGRCTAAGGVPCNPNLFRKVVEEATLGNEDIATACANPLAAWYASAGQPLTRGACYTQINFDASRQNVEMVGTLPSGSTLQPVAYAGSGGVVVAPGVSINASLSNTSPKSARILISTSGGFTQGMNSQIAMAVYAPFGSCTVNGDPALSGRYKTLWAGAATCKTLAVNNLARLRFDGGLALLFENSAARSTGVVWTMLDFESVN